MIAGVFLGWFAYFLIFTVLYLSTGSAALGYLVSDILASFIFALVGTPSYERRTFWKSYYFNANFSSTLVEFLLITVIFISLGLV